MQGSRPQQALCEGEGGGGGTPGSKGGKKRIRSRMLNAARGQVGPDVDTCQI